MRLDEKYRPKSFQELVGRDKEAGVISGLCKRGIGGRALWISGKSGTGKTTIAKILAAQYSSPFETVEVVGRQTTVKLLDDLTWRWSMFPMAELHVLIVNEAHGLSKPVIEKFLDVLESLPESVLVIFTTTKAGDDLFEEQLDSCPFKSRCVQIQLGERNIAEPFARRLKEIAEIEGLDGKPIAAYKELVNQNRSNFRACLQFIEAGGMLN